MVFLLLIAKLLFFVGYGGMAFFAIITKLNKDRDNSKINFIYALGMGPVIATLLLYYLLLIIPHQQNWFYLLVITVFFTGLTLINKKSIPHFLKNISWTISQFLNLIRLKKGLKHYFLQTNNIAIILLSPIIAYGCFNILLAQIPGHDVLEYLVQGEYFFNQKAIIYQSQNYNPVNGFYYVGLHGWSFPLQTTLEKLFDAVTFYGYDLYFRTLTLWYGILIIAVVYYFTKKHTSLFFAIAASLILVFTKGFFNAITSFHIDSYRIFLFTLSIIFILKYIKTPHINTLILLSIFAGSSAFTHSLSVLVAIFIGLTLFLFYQENFYNRLKSSIIYTFLILLFGGVHYIIDVFYGTGWIFNELDFY